MATAGYSGTPLPKKLGIRDFDVVIYCGIYYHLLEPLRAFAALREIMVEGGLIMVEGPVLDASERVFADFYCTKWLYEDPTNWWVPTIPCLREWLDCTFFDTVTEISFDKDLSQPPGPPGSVPAPIAMRTLRNVARPVRRALGRLRRFGRQSATTVDSERLDRYIVVARASSVSGRLALHLNGKGLAPLLNTPGVSAESVAGFCEAATLSCIAALAGDPTGCDHQGPVREPGKPARVRHDPG